MRPLPPPDYFAVLAAKRRTVNVALAEGGVLIVRRARLRLYAELQGILEEADDKMEAIVRYVELATECSIDEIDPDALMDVFANLVQLNEVAAPPALLRAAGTGKALPAFQFRGRWLTALVTTLVRSGFSEQYVLEEMDAGEAWLYLQEVAHADWEDYAHEYSLSDLGRDKRGKQKAIRPPEWTRLPYTPPERRQEATRLPAAARPQGVVLNFRDPKVIEQIMAGRNDA